MRFFGKNAISNRLNESSKDGTSFARVSLETLANTCGMITFPATSALVRVMTSAGGNYICRKSRRRPRTNIRKARNAGSASLITLILQNLQLVLLSLYDVPVKSHVDNNTVIIIRRVDGNIDVVNSTVRERLESRFDVPREGAIGRTPNDGLRHVRFVQFRGELHGEGFKVEIRIVRASTTVVKRNSLNLRELVTVIHHTARIKLVKIRNHVHNIVTKSAHALIARETRPSPVTNARAGAIRIPGIIQKRFPAGAEAAQRVRTAVVILIVNDPVRQIFHVFARAVSGATVRTALSTARFGFVAGVTVAFARFAVAYAFVGAFGVFVGEAGGGGGVGPGEFVGAEAVGAVPVGFSVHAPSGVARADFVNSTSSVTGTLVRTSCVCQADEG